MKRLARRNVTRQFEILSRAHLKAERRHQPHFFVGFTFQALTWRYKNTASYPESPKMMRSGSSSISNFVDYQNPFNVTSLRASRVKIQKKS